MRDLFATDQTPRQGRVELASGAVLMPGRAACLEQAMLDAISRISAISPFRRMMTPGGRIMAVAMTNCGTVGWVTDRGGYRYQPTDPETSRPWPEMPEDWRDFASQVAGEAGFDGFVPDVCLINRYEAGTRLSVHQDRDEKDFGQPIVSVSLGLPAVFQFGGLERGDPLGRHRLEHGDVVVWGGPARLRYHGIARLKPGEHPLTGPLRFNLTFRKAV